MANNRCCGSARDPREYRIGRVLETPSPPEIPVAFEVLRQQGQRPRAMGNGVLRLAAHLRERFRRTFRLEDGVPTEARARRRYNGTIAHARKTRGTAPGPGEKAMHDCAKADLSS